ncbi:MAG: DHHA1 domain-containing protein, partial [Thermodesulfobacteriota bacterium]|nr:DHHA1 domain-containing protein [Thermodesulfobacteriota bacterium]
ILGDHIKQSGSLVTPDRLRFDFTHFTAVERDELDRIESSVNQRIRENYPVGTSIVPYQEAMESGALALFGEKYSDRVRMVTIDPISSELCGGTHTQRTGNIGILKLISESSVAAGIRRIEALTGEGAVTHIKDEENRLSELSRLLKASPEEVVVKISKLIDENKSLQKEIEALKQTMVTSSADNVLDQARDIKGIKVIATRIKAENPKSLREYADRIKDQLKSGVIIVGGAGADKAFLVVVVTKDLTPALNAGKIIQEVARGIGGSGGGRPDMAQAGGKEKDKLEETLAGAYSIIEAMIP